MNLLIIIYEFFADKLINSFTALDAPASFNASTFLGHFGLHMCLSFYLGHEDIDKKENLAEPQIRKINHFLMFLLSNYQFILTKCRLAFVFIIKFLFVCIKISFFFYNQNYYSHLVNCL